MTARSWAQTHKRPAFSLTELLVVIAIVALLGALSMSAVTIAREFTKDLQAQVDAARGRVQRNAAAPTRIPTIFLADQYLLMLRDDADPAAEAARLQGVAPFELLEVYHNIYKGLAIKASPANLALLLKDPAIHYVEQDQLISVSAQTVPSGIRRIGADVPVPTSTTAATATTTTQDSRVVHVYSRNGWWFKLIFGPRPRQPVAPPPPTLPIAGEVDATVAIIDTGVNPHSDLNIVHERGFGSLANSPGDRNGHGTHVAGTVAARNNTLGVLGVAPGAKIWALKVLDGPENGGASGSVRDVQAALDYVIANASQVDVVNMSLGTSSPVPTLDAAVERCVAAGVTVVVAAGNSSQDASNASPARAANAITVGALDDTSNPGVADAGDKFASFSNYGAGIDFIAPGVRVLSTWVRDDTRILSGTSMAAPHVAGVAARVRAIYPNDSPAMVLSRMKQVVNENISGPASISYPVVNCRPFTN